MPINPDAVGSKSQPERRRWSSKDSLIYALGVGSGAQDPLAELEFTTENSQDVTQRALPTMPVVLGAGAAGAYASIGSFNPAMLVHGEQSVALAREVPVEGELEAVTEVVGVYDKGSGALVVTETTATLVDDGQSAVHHPFGRVHPGRGRLRRRPRPVLDVRRPRAGARPRGRLPDPHRPGAALPPVGRPQPAALRPQVRGDGRVRPPDPPRAVHVRVHREGPAARAVRRRPRPVPVDDRPLLEPGLPGRDADRAHLGRGRGTGPVPDDRRATAGWSSTPVRSRSAPPEHQPGRGRGTAGSRGLGVAEAMGSVRRRARE